jgi:hypothetical protein
MIILIMRSQENVLGAVTLHSAPQLHVFLSIHPVNLFKWMLLATSPGAATCVLAWLTSIREEYNSRQKGENPVRHAQSPATGHSSLALQQTAALLTFPRYTLSTLKLRIYQLHQQWINKHNVRVLFFIFISPQKNCFESCTFWNASPDKISPMEMTEASNMSINLQGWVYLSFIS